MTYITTMEAAEQWGLTTSRVLKLAQGGRIPGAKRIGYRWLIPEGAEKPADARTHTGKEEKAQEPDTFRFPGFEFRTLASFSPPLSEEELTVKAATEAFYACRFKDAEKILGNLADTTKDRYLRINALYTGCMIDIFLSNTALFFDHFGRLTAELKEDFPHKAEMVEYLHSIQATLGDDRYYSQEFRLQTNYAYHESFLPRLANLSAVYLTVATEKPSFSELRAHELNCILLQNSGAYADLVPLHLYLGIAYSELGDREKQDDHLRKALALAEKYKIYYCISSYYYHIRKLFKPVLAEFSVDFRSQIETVSKSIQQQFARFMDDLSINTVYSLLHHGDYIFLYYAVQGLTNKEIADRLHISIGTVGKRFGDIYALLNVKTKTELVALYRKTLAVTDIEQGLHG